MTDDDLDISDADIGDVFASIMKASHAMVALGIKQAKGGLSDALFLALAGIIGALKGTGALIVPIDDISERAKKGDTNFEAMKSEIDRRVTDDVMLYAALLAVTVVSDIGDGEHLKAEFGPPAFKTAMEKFKKLTGRDVTGLSDAFIQAAKNYGDLPYPNVYGKHNPKPH